MPDLRCVLWTRLRVTSPSVSGRSALALMVDRTLGPFFLGKLLSSCGIWIQNIAAAVLMYDLTASALLVGAVSAVQFSGLLLFGFLSGVLSDRFDRRRLLIVGRVVSTVGVGGLAVALLVGGVDGFGGPPVLLGGVFVMGLGLALSSPSMQAIIPSLVRDQDLEGALALSSAGPSAARAVGPAVGAGLLVVGGPELAFGVAALCHLSFVGLLQLVRGGHGPRPQERPSVFGGIRYLVEDRKAALLMLGGVALSFGVDPVITLTPAMAFELGGGSGTVGLLAAAFGIGSLAVLGVLGPLRRLVDLRWLGILGFWVLGAGLTVVALSPGIWSGAAGLWTAGLGFMLATVALNTRVQRRVPDELRGRVMALWGVAFLGSRPLAALVNGGTADLVSVQAALLVAAAVTALSSLLARVSYRRAGGQAA